VAAEVIPARTTGSQYFQSAPDNGMHASRHAHASALLDAGETIKVLAEYLGHSDPGFTLRTYTHLIPSIEARTRKAIDSAFAPEDAATGQPTLVPAADEEANVDSTPPGQAEGKAPACASNAQDLWIGFGRARGGRTFPNDP